MRIKDHCYKSGFAAILIKGQLRNLPFAERIAKYILRIPGILKNFLLWKISLCQDVSSYKDIHRFNMRKIAVTFKILKIYN